MKDGLEGAGQAWSQSLGRYLLQYQLAKDKRWWKLGGVYNFILYIQLYEAYIQSLRRCWGSSLKNVNTELNHTDSEYQLGMLQVKQTSRNLNFCFRSWKDFNIGLTQRLNHITKTW